MIFDVECSLRSAAAHYRQPTVRDVLYMMYYARYLIHDVPSTVPPLEVKILGSEDGALSEGERYSLVCESGGSRPPAVLSWWLNGVLMTDTKDQVSLLTGGSGSGVETRGKARSGIGRHEEGR